MGLKIEALRKLIWFSGWSSLRRGVCPDHFASIDWGGLLTAEFLLLEYLKISVKWCYSVMFLQQFVYTSRNGSYHWLIGCESKVRLITLENVIPMLIYERKFLHSNLKIFFFYQQMPRVFSRVIYLILASYLSGISWCTYCFGSWQQDEKSLEDENDLPLPRQTTSYSFSKTLTPSDTSTHGGFSIPKRYADSYLPPLVGFLHINNT